MCKCLPQSVEGKPGVANELWHAWAAMGKKAVNNAKGVDKQPVRLLLGGIIIGNGFCYRYGISLIGSKNWLTNNWLTKTKPYYFLTKLILKRRMNAGVVKATKELTFRHGSYKTRTGLKVFNSLGSVTRTPFFEIIIVIMLFII